MYKIIYNDCTKVYDKENHRLLGSFPTEQEADDFIDNK
jgi:hypothetical protein